MKKRKVCIVILILAIIALLIGISYLVQGIYARGLGGVNYGSVIFPLLVGVIAVYFMKKKLRLSLAVSPSKFTIHLFPKTAGHSIIKPAIK